MTRKAKKAGRFALLLSLLLCLSACSTAPQEPPAPEEKPISVGFSQVGTESDWRVANTASMESALSAENGYRLDLRYAQQKQEQQIVDLYKFINQGVDYIVLAPTTERGWETILSRVRDSGIPVIIVDRMIEIEDESLFTCWVGSDFRQEGKTAVEWMEKTFADKSLNIIHLQGNIGSSAQIGRTEGLDEGLKAHDNWTLAFRQSGDFTQAKGQELVEEVIEKNLLDRSGNTINVIYSENDNMSYGAIDALKKAGLTPGKDVYIISFDAASTALRLVLKGEIAYDVECNPLHGPRVKNLIEQLKEGKTPPKYTYVEETAFSKDNLTEELISTRGY